MVEEELPPLLMIQLRIRIFEPLKVLEVIDPILLIEQFSMARFETVRPVAPMLIELIFNPDILIPLP